MIRAAIALGLAAVYAPVVARMAHVWWTDQYAGHGLFVPAFAGVLLWLDRGRLRRVERAGSPAGGRVVALALGLLGIGVLAQSLLVQGLSIVLAAAGLVLWWLGWAVLRQAAFPIGFLILMVPLPRALVDAVTLALQMFAAGFAASVLDLFDVPIYQEGVYLVLPTLTLAVAEVCNGLRFLAALVVLAIAFAEVSQRTWPRKAVLAASAVPIAILANAVRVAVIGLGVHYWGPQVASGVIHHGIGKAVWAATLVPLVALGWYLRRGSAGPAHRVVEYADSSQTSR